MPPLGVAESRTDRLFDSGSAKLSAGGKGELRRVLRDFPRHHPITIEVFRHERDKQVKVQRYGSLPELSVQRANALAEYLRSPAGGGWTVASSVGRGYAVVNGRAPDRRVVFTSLGETVAGWHAD